MKGLVDKIIDNGTQIIEIIVLILCGIAPVAINATGLFRGLAGVFSGGAVGWGILGAAGVVFGLYKLHT